MLYLACLFSEEKRQASPIKIDGFDAVKWRTDSTGCNKTRYPLARILLKSKNKIFNHNRNEVKAFLGKANETLRNGNIESYYIEAGVQCLPIYKNNPGPLEVAKLVVDYENDIVVDVRIIII